MPPFLRSILGALCLVIALVVAAPASADVPAPGDFSPAVWSDKPDYMPGEQVNLYGANWTPGETVHLTVNDDSGSTWSRSVDVTADQAGGISDTFNLPDWFVAQYSVRAEGRTSLAVATHTFTDGNVTFLPSSDSPGLGNLTVKYRAYNNGTCDGPVEPTTTPALQNWVTGQSAIPVNGANRSIRIVSVSAASGTPIQNITLGETGPALTLPTCIDGTGNGSQTFYAHASSDNTAPTITFSQAPNGTNGWFKTSPATLTVTANDNVAINTLACTIDGSPETLTPVSSTTTQRVVTLSTTAEGDHAISCTATDNATNSTTETTHVKLDTVNPVVTVTVSPAAPLSGFYNAPPTVSVTATDTNIASLSCTVDGSPVTLTNTTSTSTSKSGDVPVSGDGAHSVLCTALDAGGLVGSDSKSYAVDTNTPSSSADSPTTSDTNGFSVAYTASDTGTGASGLASVELWVKTPSASSFAKVATDSTPGATGSFAYTAAAGDGTYRFYTVATDNAGNTEAAPGTEDDTTTVDTAAPVVTITLSPASPDGTNDWYKSQPTVTAEATDAHLASLTCTVDNSPVTLGSGGSVPVSGQGSHTIDCLATDDAGNIGNASKTYKLDSIEPTVSVTLSPASPNGDNGWYTSQPTVTVSSSDANLASTTCEVDGVAVTIGGGGSVPVSGDGSHHVVCTATDAAGNSDSATMDFKVDSTSPTVDVELAPAAPNGTGGWYKTQPSVTVASSDAHLLSTTCTVDGDPATVGAGGSISVSGQGSHTISCTAEDDAGNTANDSETYKLDSIDPEISLTLDPATPDGAGGYYLSAPAVTVASSDTNLASTTCEVDGSEVTIGTVGSVPVSGDGSHTVSCTATDEAGNTKTATKTFKVDGTDPVVDVTLTPATPNGGSGFYQTQPTVTVTATDAHLATVACTVDGNSATVGAGGEITVTGDGEHTISCTATDDAGNDASDSASYKLDSQAPSSSATSPALDNDGSFDVTYSASDDAPSSGLDKVELWVSKDGAAFAMYATDTTPDDTRSFSFTGTGDGTYAFYTRAHDKAGNAEDAPAAADDETLVDSVPPVSDASSPQFDNDGSFSVDYTASDAALSSGLDAVELFVKKPGSASYVSAGSDSSPTASGSISFALAAGDVDGDYAFYTVATDKAGNAEAAPATADDSTLVDRAKPHSQADSPTYDVDGNFTVTYTSSDDAPASGVDQVELWVKGPTNADYVLWGTDMTPGATGSFAFSAANQGTYRFYTVAVDKAGNREAVPMSPDDSVVVEDDSTVVDGLAPTTTHDVPDVYVNHDVEVTLTATDTGTDNSGVDKTYYEVGTLPATPTALSPVYDPNSKPVLHDGEKISFYSVDRAGNAEGVTTSPAAKVDKAKPTTTDDVPTAWQNTDVVVTLDPQDTGGSGVDKTYYTTGTAPADPTTSSQVYDPYSKPTLGNGEVIKYFTVDNAGNAEAVQTSIPAKVDKAAPTIDLVRPTQGAAYVLGSGVLADYTCTDTGGSLLTSCIGTVPNGSAIDTATIGAKPFNVAATDGAGNVTAEGVSYTVVYGFDGFLQPINDTAHQTGVLESKFRLGSTVPVKFQIKNAAGTPLQQSVLPTFQRGTNRGACDSSTQLEPTFTDTPTPGTAFRWDSSLGGYIYNFSTKGLTAGEYRIYANVADGTQKYVDLCLTK